MMKAIVKATGQVIEVSCGTAVAGNVLYRDMNTNATYTGDELEPAELDLRKYHIQAAITAMGAELSNPNQVFSMCEDKVEIITSRAIRYADALVDKLREGRNYADIQQ